MKKNSYHILCKNHRNRGVFKNFVFVSNLKSSSFAWIYTNNESLSGGKYYFVSQLGQVFIFCIGIKRFMDRNEIELYVTSGHYYIRFC